MKDSSYNTDELLLYLLKYIELKKIILKKFLIVRYLDIKKPLFVLIIAVLNLLL
jgi:hypothetical protein